MFAHPILPAWALFTCLEQAVVADIAGVQRRAYAGLTQGLVERLQAGLVEVGTLTSIEAGALTALQGGHDAGAFVGVAQTDSRGTRTRDLKPGALVTQKNQRLDERALDLGEGPLVAQQAPGG